MQRNNLWLTGLIAVALALLASVAVAETPFPQAREKPAEARASLWTDAFLKFYANHPDLAADQLMVIWDAVDAGTPAAFRRTADKEIWRSGPGAPLVEIIQRVEKHFTDAQLGEIFSAMGPTQLWLVENAALAAPLCNCRTIGATCAPPFPQPNHCATGCQSWSDKDSNGNWRHWVGVCTPGPSPYDETREGETGTGG